MSNAEREATNTPLRDVAAIANELMRPRQPPAETVDDGSQSKVIRVERHSMSRSPEASQLLHPVPAKSLGSATSGSGLGDELQKLDSKLEAIMRSVEFTEAHVAMNGKPVATNIAAIPTPTDGSTRQWWLRLSLSVNVVLLALLASETDGRLITSISRSYLEAMLTATGWR